MRRMQAVAIPQITERLEKLPTDKLVVVYDFVSYLLEREAARALSGEFSEAFQTMLASEAVLRRDWDRPDAKRRPALVIASLTGDDVILCQITSKSVSDSYAIPITKTDFASGGLPQDSNVRPI